MTGDFPGALVVWVAVPLDQVPWLSIDDLLADDLLDFVE
jgi:hypothetical protein